jgi:hypothetical protein
VALPDGRYLVGGSGALEGRHHLVRLNADGTVDTTFTLPEPDGPVNALALQDDGKVLVGGYFTNLGQAYQPAQRRDPARSARLYGGLSDTGGAGDFIAGEEAGLCRLNVDGSNDTSFGNPGVSRVTTLAVRGNRIAIGGEAKWSTGFVNSIVDKIVLYLTDESGRIVTFASPERIPRAVAVQSGNRLLFAPGNQYGEMHTHPSVAMLQPTSEAADWWGVKQVFTDGLPTLLVVVQNPTYRVQEFDGDVNALLAQADGKVLVGGSLTAARVAVDTDAGGFSVPASLAESNPTFWSANDTPSSMPLRGFAQLDVDGFFNSVVPEPGRSDGLSAIDVHAAPSALSATAVINTTLSNGPGPNDSLVLNSTFWPRITMPDPAAGATWFIDGPDASAFSLHDAGLMRLAYVGAPLVMNVKFTPLHTGAHRAVLHVNKTGGETMDIALTASSATALSPAIKISVTNSTTGTSTNLESGMMLDFTEAYGIASSTRTLTLTNTGSTAITTPLMLSIAGLNASDFTITQPPAYPIAPGGSTDLTITFRATCEPSTSRLAGLYIKDSTTGLPFELWLSGSAAMPPSLQPPWVRDAVLIKGQSIKLICFTACGQVMRWQWFKGLQRLTAAPGATSQELSLDAVSASSAGSYTVEAMNTLGLAKSDPTRVAVIDMEPKTLVKQPGQSLQLECKVAGDYPVTYQWKFNGVPLSGAAFTGVDSAKLTIKSVTTASVGDYTCIVKLGNTIRASPPITLRLDVAPVLLSGLGSTTWRVTQPVNEQISFNSVAPMAIISRGLPPGVVINKTTGLVTGKPTKAGTYLVRFQAWNVRGHSSIVDQTITVLPWAPGFVGTFYGSVMLGSGHTVGDWTLVAASNGSFTAKLRQGDKSISAGKNGGGENLFGGISTSSFTGSLTFSPESASISHATATVIKSGTDQLDVVITITDGVAHAQYTRATNGVITAGEASPVMRAMPSRFAGTFSSALNARGLITATPSVKSLLRFTVGTNRVFTWSANLGTSFGGRVFTGSCPVLENSGEPWGNVFAVMPTTDGGHALIGGANADALSSPLNYNGQFGWATGTMDSLTGGWEQWFDFTATKGK